MAAKGKMEFLAQKNEMSLSAMKDITLYSANGKVIISAEQEIWIGAGGSYICINGSGIVNGSPGPILEKSASWDASGADSQRLKFALPEPMSDSPNWIELNHHYDDLEAVKNAPYKLHFSDGSTIAGKLDANGFAHIDGVPPGEASVELGEDK